MNETTLTPDRLAAVDAAIAAKTFANLDLQRGYGGEMAAQWRGDESLPILLPSELEPFVPRAAEILGFPLLKAKDLEGASVYARP